MLLYWVTIVLSQCLDILFEISLKRNSVAFHALLIQMHSYAVFSVGHKRFANQALMISPCFHLVVPSTGLFCQLSLFSSDLLHEVFFHCVSTVVASKVGHQQFLVVNDRSSAEEALVTLHFEYFMELLSSPLGPRWSKICQTLDSRGSFPIWHELKMYFDTSTMNKWRWYWVTSLVPMPWHTLRNKSEAE